MLNSKFDSIHGRMDIVSNLDRNPTFAVTRSGPACYYRVDSPTIRGNEIAGTSWKGPFPSADSAFTGGIHG